MVEDTQTMRALNLRRRIRHRTSPSRLLLISSAVVIGCFATIFSTQFGADFYSAGSPVLTSSHTNLRHLLSVTANTTSNPVTTTNMTATTTVDPLSNIGAFPPDAFTLEQLRQGAVVLHCMGMIYMFVALAIVCDEFFVPALGVITQKLNISEDVAGATFMAAGGSAPELATSLIGAFFITNSSVGIGTIVGSAVFNILFVIGMCAIFSKEVLSLTWWPLFRDCFFYAVFLGILIATYIDGYIQVWESVILLVCYIIYVTFMKFNHNIEAFVKNKLLRRNRITQVQSTSSDNLVNAESKSTQRSTSIPILRGGSAKFRHGILQLMIHTIDPLHEGKVHDKAIQLHAIAALNVTINPDTGEQLDMDGTKSGHIQRGQISINGTGTFLATTTSHGGHLPPSNGSHLPRQNSQQTTITSIESLPDNQDYVENTQVVMRSAGVEPRSASREASQVDSTDTTSEKSQPEELEEEEEPLDMSWPETHLKRFTYIILAPIVFPLWIMLPDVRRPEKRKWFALSFLGSILWIGIYSYLMVWFAKVTGVTAGIEDPVMGITFLAAGTSIPDLITSVIVARKGFGDMAVSSSVGSNIFDITVGLPFPWLLWSIIFGGPVKVDKEGLICSILMLLGMLIIVISCIAAFKWKMSRWLGGFMFFLYVIFLTISLLLLADEIPCPVL